MTNHENQKGPVEPELLSENEGPPPQQLRFIRELPAGAKKEEPGRGRKRPNRVKDTGDKAQRPRPYIVRPKTWNDLVSEFGHFGGAFRSVWYWAFGPPKPKYFGDTRFEIIEYPASTANLAIRREHSIGLAVLTGLFALLPTILLGLSAAGLFAVIQKGALLFIDIPLWTTIGMLFLSVMGVAWGVKSFLSYPFPWNWVFAIIVDALMATSKLMHVLMPEWETIWYMGMVTGAVVNWASHWAYFYYSITGKAALTKMAAQFGDLEEAQRVKDAQAEWAEMQHDIVIDYKPARKRAGNDGFFGPKGSWKFWRRKKDEANDETEE